MLELKQNGTVIQMVNPGSRYRLPNGDYISPAVVGWADGEFSLELQAARPEPTPAEALATERTQMVCSPMQGILALGEARWQVILDYRNAVDVDGNPTTPWAQKVIIDSAQDWRRLSENISFFMYLLNLTPEEADDLFRVAVHINA